MLTPVPGQDIPTNGSSRLVNFVCECGKTTAKPWKSYASGHARSCGKCGVVSADQWKLATYGKLRMLDPMDVHARSHKRVVWQCDCGRQATLPVASVTSGNTSSCGKCSSISAEQSSVTKFGSLLIKHPAVLTPGCRTKVEWTCDCGRVAVAAIGNVVRGLTRSCGKCKVLLADHFAETKYGKLRMKTPADYHPNSDKQAVWVCECGNEIETRVSYVVSGDTKSCGWCKAVDPAGVKYGKLRAKSAAKFRPGSHAKVVWQCDCGGEVTAAVFNVTRGFTASCGACYDRALKWYAASAAVLRSLQTPVLPHQIPAGFMQALEPIVNTGIPFKALCGACLSEYKPTWDNVRLGKSLTCGCCTHRVSKGQTEIAEYVRSLGVPAEVEFVVGGLKYDIAVESRRLLVEYNGLRWHSGTEGRRRDTTKYRNAACHGWSMVSFYEDEWIRSPDKIKSILRNKLGLSRTRSVRPSKCELRTIQSSEADEFYSAFHYIGGAKAKINLGAFLGDKLVACMSFKRPTRQSAHQWELVRMASHPDVRVHGIWSKLLRWFVDSHNPLSIVSFSDNRLFDGGVYAKLGFSLDGEIPPDYYWCKGQRRWHKSGLRKTADERLSGLTERELRSKQGYFRVWDLGKKRWIMKPA